MMENIVIDAIIFISLFFAMYVWYEGMMACLELNRQIKEIERRNEYG